MTTAASVLRPVLGTFQLWGIAFGPVGGYVAGAATLVEFVFAPPAIELAIGASKGVFPVFPEVMAGVGVAGGAGAG